MQSITRPKEGKQKIVKKYVFTGTSCTLISAIIEHSRWSPVNLELFPAICCNSGNKAEEIAKKRRIEEERRRERKRRLKKARMKEERKFSIRMEINEK